MSWQDLECLITKNETNQERKKSIPQRDGANEFDIFNEEESFLLSLLRPNLQRHLITSRIMHAYTEGLHNCFSW